MVSAEAQPLTPVSVATVAPDEKTTAVLSPNTATTLPASATAFTGPTLARPGFQSTGRTDRGVSAPAARVCGAGPHPVIRAKPAAEASERQERGAR